MTEWIGAAEAAQRLGIKQATLYAYVSRGVLGRRREADGRGSMFDADEVGELARRGRPRRTGGSASTGPSGSGTGSSGNGSPDDGSSGPLGACTRAPLDPVQVDFLVVG